ncbi:MAG: hypothetical protein O3A37_02510, partial [Planctomycetota bacterium]|nr:hypothetical protein [Planctomycetota bacterium]
LGEPLEPPPTSPARGPPIRRARVAEVPLTGLSFDGPRGCGVHACRVADLVVPPTVSAAGNIVGPS